MIIGTRMADPSLASTAMAVAPSPVEVGTRGTIGSLISQEIEYFRKLEVERRGDSNQKRHDRSAEVASSSGELGQGSAGGSSKKVEKKKKKTATDGGGFVPSICSAVDITDTSPMARLTGYRNLRADEKKLPQD